MPSKTESKVSQTILAFDQFDKEAVSLPPVLFTGHQRSRTTVASSSLYSRTPSASPTRSSVFGIPRSLTQKPSTDLRTPFDSKEHDSPLSDTQRKAKSGKVGKIASWFDGSSDPVDIKIVASPQKEILQPLYQLDREAGLSKDSLANMNNLTSRPKRVETTTNNSANSSRFSFFWKNTASQINSDPDELIHMDVREALMPDGPVEVTPASFKALQLNAEALLRRFQLSYTENLGALKRITSEKNAQTDELEASQTRSEHLRSQLGEMAERVTDQEDRIAVLKSQLTDEYTTVRMVQDSDEFRPRYKTRRGRVSDASSSDESIVDSEMSSAVSVFSVAESTQTSASSIAGIRRMNHARLQDSTIVPDPHTHSQCQTPFALVGNCQNCHNNSAQEAWELVEMMKMENTYLKGRLAELESASDSALNFLGTLKL